MSPISASRAATQLAQEPTTTLMPPRRSTNRIPITPEMIAQLRAQMARTGISSQRMLWNAKDKPEGITSGIIETWLSGGVTTARPEHFAYALARWLALPDAAPRPQPGPSQGLTRRAITPEELAELRVHRKRTSIGGAVLLRNATDIPSGVTPSMISGLVNGSIRSAKPEHIAYILARYRVRP